MVLLTIAAAYFVTVLLVAVHMQRHGYVFAGSRRATLLPQTPDDTLPALSQNEQDLIEKGSIELLGTIQLEGTSADEPGSRAYLSADRRILLFCRSASVLGEGVPPRFDLYSFGEHGGKIATVLGMPSVTAGSPSGVTLWLNEPIDADQMVVLHRRALATAERHGLAIRQLTPDGAFSALQQADEAELDLQVRAGIARRLPQSFWRFTFKANLLTAFKFVTPFTRRNRDPEKQLQLFEKKLRRLRPVATSA
jgi:hypothetical protein